MEAYAYAAEITQCSVVSVRNYVSTEDELGLDALESKRDNCGAVTRYSPRKKQKIDQLMEETEGDVTQREVQAAL